MISFSPIEDFIFFIDIFIRLMIFEQISGLKISIKKKLLISFILTFLLFILFGGRFHYLLEPISLVMIIPFFNTGWNIMQRLFYGLLPMIIGDMFQRIIGLYLRFLFNVNITDFNNTIGFSILLTFLLIPFYYYFFKGLRIEAKYLQVDTENRELFPVFWGLNILFITYFILIRGNLLIEIAIEEGKLNLNWDTYFIRTNILLIYFALFTIGLLYLNNREKDKKDKELQHLKDQQVSDLSQYSHHVESLYHEIRGFRHDYTNILVSLNEAIKDEDMPLIKSIYEGVLADSDKKFYEGKYDIARLSHLQNPAMKSILSAKLLEAQNKGIEVAVEIDEKIDIPDIELIDFMTLLSILMDNAIEAAQQCESGSIVFAYLQDDARKILFIENTTLEEKVDIDAIYQYGYSSKGDNRGIGLANVKTILNKYHKISLATQSHQHRFSQELTFMDKS